MQRIRSKRYRAAVEQVDRSKTYPLADAVSTLKKFPPTKFDQTVTVSFQLRAETKPSPSDQTLSAETSSALRQRRQEGRSCFDRPAQRQHDNVYFEFFAFRVQFK